MKMDNRRAWGLSMVGRPSLAARIRAGTEARPTGGHFHIKRRISNLSGKYEILHSASLRSE